MPPGLEWEMLPDLMPSGPLREPEKFAKWVHGGQPIWEFVSDNLFLVDEHAHNEIRLVADDPDITLWMTADPPVRNWVVYRPALDAPFVSLEPVSWVHDAPNLPEPVERTGARLLPPGDRAEFRYTLGIRTGT
jgi:aldose 1-epimerase